jgi:MFS family permease
VRAAYGQSAERAAGPAEHKWGFRIAIAAATIGIIYGYDLGAIAGALLFITKDFDLSTKQTESVATIVVVGSIVGALTGGRLANAIGRKPAMVIVAVFGRRDRPQLGPYCGET